MNPGSTIHDKLYDAIIVGGGPAGSSCAVWLARLGFSPILVEAAAAVGGLCRSHTYPDVWNATLPGMTGAQVADNLAQSLREAMVPVHLETRVKDINVETYGFSVSTDGEEPPLRGRNVVLASGVLPRGLPECGGLPGVLVGPGSHISNLDFSSKHVAVLGGGDNAVENALYALQHNGVEYDLLLVFYGWEPCAGYASSLGLRYTAEGFIATDMHTSQTSCPGVYAIGEVAQRQHPCVVTALADGVTAAKAIQATIETY
jgi:thioredoxin reductase (NADPH)